MAKETRKRAAKSGRPARCVYCGMHVLHPVGDGPPTCKAHRDLPDRDPFYTELAGVA